jgi:hypothetical protein
VNATEPSTGRATLGWAGLWSDARWQRSVVRVPSTHRVPGSGEHPVSECWLLRGWALLVLQRLSGGTSGSAGAPGVANCTCAARGVVSRCLLKALAAGGVVWRRLQLLALRMSVHDDRCIATTTSQRLILQHAGSHL